MVSIAGVSEPNSPSQRATTTDARQLPTTLTVVRAISIRASMPRMTKIGLFGQVEHGNRGQQHNQGRAGNPSHSFAGEHEGANHEDLLLPAHVHAGGLGNKNRGQGKIERGTIQIEAIARGDHKGDNPARNTQGFHRLHGARQRRF